MSARTQEMQSAMREVYDPQPSFDDCIVIDPVKYVTDPEHRACVDAWQARQDVRRYDGTSRPAPLDEVLPGHEADDKVPGGGIVRAVGIVAVLAFLANVAAQVWPK